MLTYPISPMRVLVLLAVVTGLFALYLPTAAVAFQTEEQRSESEEWVIEQVTAGLEADLSKRFSTRADRVLRRAFFEALLLDPAQEFNIHRRGIRISNAIVEEPLDLEFADISHELRLIGVTFESDIDFSQSVFRKNLSLEGSSFQKNANFRNINVAGTANFASAEFMGPVDFAGAAVNISFTAAGSRFQGTEALDSDDEDPVNASFERMVVTGDADFEGAEFSSAASFDSANFGGDLKVASAVFKGFGVITFEKINVAGDLDLFSAAFSGAADFKEAKIRGDFEAEEVRFSGGVGLDENYDMTHEFSKLKVDGTLWLDAAVFDTPANFKEASILAISSPITRSSTARARAASRKSRSVATSICPMPSFLGRWTSVRRTSPEILEPRVLSSRRVPSRMTLPTRKTSSTN